MMLKYLDTQHDPFEKHMWEAETVIWRPNTDTEQRHTHACEFAPLEILTVSLQSCV